MFFPKIFIFVFSINLTECRHRLLPSRKSYSHELFGLHSRSFYPSSLAVTCIFDSTHCNAFFACFTLNLSAFQHLHMTSVCDSITSGISTAEVYLGCKENIECFRSIAFRLKTLLSKSDAVCVRAPDTCEDFTSFFSSTLRVTMRDQMLPAAPFAN